jgi:hypothetical protein
MLRTWLWQSSLPQQGYRAITLFVELVLWENEGHVTFLSNPEIVGKDLVARVRPLATEDTTA